MATGPASAGGGRRRSSIPDDLLVCQILVLLPVKSLLRFQSVCKLWRAAITSAGFVRRHLEVSKAKASSSMVLVPRNRKCEGDLMRRWVRGVHIYSFQPGQANPVAERVLEKNFADRLSAFTIPLHCDGLILIPGKTGQVFVCNPATREFVQLPPSSSAHIKTVDCRATIGFDPWSGTYKVSRPFLRSYSTTRIHGQETITEYSIGHEILTLGGGKEAWKWKEAVDPPYPIKNRTPICLPGSIYWSGSRCLTYYDDDEGVESGSDVILRFSLRDETFTVHPNPPCREFLSFNDALCEVGGKL